MTRAITVEILGDASKFHSATQQATQSGGGLLSSITGVAAGMGVFSAASAAAGAAMDFLGDSLTAGSDRAEQLSKVNVVFGDWSEDIQHFAETAATSLGMSQTAALTAAGTFGNLFSAMGIGAEPTADMSEGLITLAGDLASFNNMEPTEVLDALRSGLVGETEPLRALGVNINAAQIEAKALEMGLSDGTTALTAAQKAQASYALIMEQTTQAQGDFARTSDGAANQTRIQQARMEDLQATIGTKLQPVFTKLLEVFSNIITVLMDVFDAMEPVIDSLVKELGPAFEVIGDIAAKVFPILIEYFKFVIKFWTEVVTTIVSTVQEVISVFSMITVIVQKVFGSVGTIIKGAINGVIGIINGIIGAINRIQVHIHVGPVNLDWNGLNIGRIPTLHAGGIVPGVPGSDVLTMLQAGERVIPRNGGGAPQMVTINVYGPTYGDGIDQLAKQIALRLRLQGA